MDILFADKPAGITTHTSLGEKEIERAGFLREINDGFCEHLAARSAQKLFVSHRLDRDTTGCIVFAKSPETAEWLRERFASHKVAKRYLFLTDRKISQGREQFTSESFIERRGPVYISSTTTPANSNTHFKLLGAQEGLSLWEARPETGKPHQIRLHAADAGMPILGDQDHGGSAFATLCLHSESLRINIDGNEDLVFSMPPPRWFTDLTLGKNPLLLRWLVALDRRERLLRSWSACSDSGTSEAHASERTLRWLHTESDPLRADQLGTYLWLSWFRDHPPTREELQTLETLAQTVGWREWSLHLRADRGRATTNPLIEAAGCTQPPARWLVREGGLRFEMRADQGLSPGLFLDQRQNRNWLQENARGKTVLNLFCYTGGFSVAAAKGGASRVVSIDLSKTFLEWSKVNFHLNALSLENHEFRAIDSREYLRWAKKKGLKFDLVICDPPSFSRSENGIFKIERDLEDLLSALIQVTSSGGRVLFASNFESWKDEEFEERVRTFAKTTPRLRLLRTPSPDWDFELPGSTRIMKSVFLCCETR
jgi:23S rRNA (cytosine1962-C5)-methyltransferase